MKMEGSWVMEPENGGWLSTNNNTDTDRKDGTLSPTVPTILEEEGEVLVEPEDAVDQPVTTDRSKLDAPTSSLEKAHETYENTTYQGAEGHSIASMGIFGPPPGSGKSDCPSPSSTKPSDDSSQVSQKSRAASARVWHAAILVASILIGYKCFHHMKELIRYFPQASSNDDL
mmetsp:Transcript_26248/g.34041  ORF Transcript_26248/g.34041 Transcript_26248/m.34041 type:complete len:172 (-) Transcript_26248:360-875(-)|eukprot:CAMPEP_0117761546 /NCGR_PEP_ID=MMETSP0947-20121206/17351_1 /TAXON_ID=44440 /ORGANISM="Chattonella subsalsa, Strain CCMP2191" /LENGTH=171 /DNA_ID=CAMNT_0005582571 /DNA_START=67 /DNA_END=582 /DNA_ORIENTATION=-